MEVTNHGVAVSELITAVKNSIKRAGASRSSSGRDLQVSSVQLTLQVIAAKSAGGRLNFQIPFIGMQLSAGAKVSVLDTHTINITLIPPALSEFEVRGGDIDEALVNAIFTIRETMALASAGDDPWVLSAGTVDLSFAINKAGSISLGGNGELSSEIRHILRLDLTPVRHDAVAKATYSQTRDV